MSEEYPLISLVIPVYNTERFLEKCFKSAIAQDYPNLEILILNNGSTDGSQTIIDKYKELDTRIVAYKIEHVATVKESKDNCYYRAKADWIITLDSDDAIDDGYVTKLWQRHLETSADVVLACMVSTTMDGKEIGTVPKQGFDFSKIVSGKDAVRMTIGKWDIGLNGALTHRKNINNVYISNPDCLFYTDEFDGRLLLNAAGKVAFSQAKYSYTFNPNSVGKKLSWNKFKYRLLTRQGLVPFVRDNFSIKSKEYEAVTYQSLGFILLSLNYYIKNKKKLPLSVKDDIKEHTMKLLCLIDLEWTGINYFRNLILLLLNKFLIRILF